MGGALGGFALHTEPIFGSLWKELDYEKVVTIENKFECCSFNGTDTLNTWAGDVEEYEECTSRSSWDPMETCWEKYDALSKHIHDLEHVLFYFIVVQVFDCFFKLYLIQKVPETENKHSRLGLSEEL